MGAGAVTTGKTDSAYAHLIDPRKKWYNNRRIIALHAWIVLLCVRSSFAHLSSNPYLSCTVWSHPLPMGMTEAWWMPCNLWMLGRTTSTHQKTVNWACLMLSRSVLFRRLFRRHANVTVRILALWLHIPLHHISPMELVDDARSSLEL